MIVRDQCIRDRYGIIERRAINVLRRRKDSVVSVVYDHAGDIQITKGGVVSPALNDMASNMSPQEFIQFVMQHGAAITQSLITHIK